MQNKSKNNISAAETTQQFSTTKKTCNYTKTCYYTIICYYNLIFATKILACH